MRFNAFPQIISGALAALCLVSSAALADGIGYARPCRFTKRHKNKGGWQPGCQARGLTWGPEERTNANVVP